MPGRLLNLGGWVRDVIDDSVEGGPIEAGLLDVRCDHGEL